MPPSSPRATPARTDRPRRAGANPHRAQAEACASAVLSVVPAVMDALRATMRRHVGDQLSVPQFRCLNFIAEQPGCGVGAVAAFLGVTMPTASAMVGRLVQAKAVATRTDPDDGRRIRLRLTAAGRAQLEQIRQAARGELAAALSRHDTAELQALQQGLLSLQRAFEPSDVT